MFSRLGLPLFKKMTLSKVIWDSQTKGTHLSIFMNFHGRLIFFRDFFITLQRAFRSLYSYTEESHFPSI